MAEVTYDLLIDLAEDYIRSVGAKTPLYSRTLLTTRREQDNTFNVVILLHEPTSLQACIHTIAAAKNYDQMVLATESAGYAIDTMETAEVMRITAGKAENLRGLVRLIEQGVLPHTVIPQKYVTHMVHVTAQSLRSGQSGTLLFYIEGEFPNRTFVPMEQSYEPEAMTNALLPLLPKPTAEMSDEERNNLAHVGALMMLSNETVLTEFEDLDPDMKPSDYVGQ